jgi:hypothetical protein
VVGGIIEWKVVYRGVVLMPRLLRGEFTDPLWRISRRPLDIHRVFLEYTRSLSPEGALGFAASSLLFTNIVSIFISTLSA